MSLQNKYNKRKEHGCEKQTSSEIIECKCGCGEKLHMLDKWGRKREYISGHNGRKYSDPKEYKQVWLNKHKADKNNIIKDNNSSRLRCQQHKVNLLIMYGGVCTECGLKYDGSNACCFDFHHKDISNKLFNVNAATFNKYSKDKIYKEAEKCIILCANCHRIVHRLNPY